jgi:HSP20 family molecular chaperone IbpA
MTETKDVNTQQAAGTQQTSEQERTMRPAVDIFEDATGITLHADMPGVTRERLDIQIDGDSLSISGDVEIPVPDNMNAVYADVHSNRYQRSFSLSKELDANNVEATLKHGVLILRIPKREEHKPRKIEVQAD